MINIYNWSYEIDKNLVRLEFDLSLKKKILTHAQKFNALQLPLNTQENEVILKFKSNKTCNDFIVSLFENYPNSFHLQNVWEISKSSECIISLTSISTSPQTLDNISALTNSLFADCNTISMLTPNEAFDVQLNVDTSICYITFSLMFSDQIEADNFLKDFNNFKA